MPIDLTRIKKVTDEAERVSSNKRAVEYARQRDEETQRQLVLTKELWELAEQAIANIPQIIENMK